MEIWKIIPHTNNLYEASTEGRIRRVVGWVSNGVGYRKVGGRVLSQKTKSNGYKEVNLYIAPQKSSMTYVHRAVASAFIGEIPDGYVVNHKDGNKENNRVSNLEIVTYSGNSKHAFDCGLCRPPSFQGDDHPRAKLNSNDVLTMRKLHSSGTSPRTLSDKFNCPLSTVRKVVYRQTWKHI